MAFQDYEQFSLQYLDSGDTHNVKHTQTQPGTPFIYDSEKFAVRIFPLVKRQAIRPHSQEIKSGTKIL